MKIAVVGSGCSGLAATWLLNEYSEHDVHLYEADDRPGGHANTVPFHRPEAMQDPVNVDAGFVVLNASSYPNLMSFLTQEGIPVVPTGMTFAVSRDSGAFEWAGINLFTVFCQPKSLLDPSMWRLIWDVMRFNASARRLLKSETEDPKLSIGMYLKREGYSDAFRDNYLMPMAAALWSTPADECASDFPAMTLIRWMNNHHLLQLTGKPPWLTIKGGSRVYVDRIISRLPTSQLHLSTPVASIKSSTQPQSSVKVTTADGQTSAYDHVILACHSNTSLQILERGGQVTPQEREVLGGFQWTKNETVLHFDTRLMPCHRVAWSSWNYLASSVRKEEEKMKPSTTGVALTYWMNKLQHISQERYGPVLVTLNPPFEPHPEMVIGRYVYDHPVITAEGWTSQRDLPSIQGTRGISYVGAWTSCGFHEDGFTSGLAAAATLSARPPFEIRHPDRDPGTLWPAYIFNVLERTGARRLVAFFLVTVLTLIRGVMHVWTGQRGKRA